MSICRYHSGYRLSQWEEVLLCILWVPNGFVKSIHPQSLWLLHWHWDPLQWRHNGRDGVSNHQRLDFYSIVCSGADQRKHQSSASLAFVRGIHRWPVNSPHKGPVMQKVFPFHGAIMHKIVTLGTMGKIDTGAKPQQNPTKREPWCTVWYKHVSFVMVYFCYHQSYIVSRCWG